MNKNQIFLIILLVIVIYYYRKSKANDWDKSYLDYTEMFAVYKINEKTGQGIASIEPDIASDEDDCGIAIYNILNPDGSVIHFDSFFHCCAFRPELWSECETIDGEKIEVYLTIPVKN